MLGNLWRQNIYLASATLEKSPSFSWVLLVEVLEGLPWGGAVGQSWRAAAVLIFDLACKHSHSRLARGAGCCCLPCQHTGADIFPIGSFSAVRVIFPSACFSSTSSAFPPLLPWPPPFSLYYFLVFFWPKCFSPRDWVSFVFTAFYSQKWTSAYFSLKFSLECFAFFPLNLNSFFDSRWIFLINRRSSSSSTVYKNHFGPNVTRAPFALVSPVPPLFFSLSHHPLLALPLLL